MVDSLESGAGICSREAELGDLRASSTSGLARFIVRVGRAALPQRVVAWAKNTSLGRWAQASRTSDSGRGTRAEGHRRWQSRGRQRLELPTAFGHRASSDADRIGVLIAGWDCQTTLTYVHEVVRTQYLAGDVRLLVITDVDIFRDVRGSGVTVEYVRPREDGKDATSGHTYVEYLANSLEFLRQAYGLSEISLCVEPNRMFRQGLLARVQCGWDPSSHPKGADRGRAGHV